MTDSDSTASSARHRFAERYGIDRRRAFAALSVIGGILVVSLFVMNRRLQERTAGAAVEADSMPAPGLGEIEFPSEGRAAWADPEEARKLIGDTAEVRAGAVDRYVPLGREIGPGAYGAAARGLPDPPTTPVDSMGAAAIGNDDVPRSPDDLRRHAFLRAVASRRLRGGGDETADRGVAATPVTGPTLEGGPEASGGVASTELRPYGAEQAGEDERAAERAVVEPPSISATPVSYVHGAWRGSRCGESGRVLAAGYAITATLVTEINSEVPGQVLARIGRDVYDPGLRCVLIPAGALLVGRYPEGLQVGGERLVIVWETVRWPDGRSVALPSLPSADRRGSVGVPGEVDRRSREVLAQAALLSAVGASIAYASPGDPSPPPAAEGYPAPASARDRAVSAATQPLRSAVERLVARAVDARPIVRVPMGTPITIIVSQDIDLDTGTVARPAVSAPAASAAS